jgi:DNA (cytosine-5)-methyltransferase 1
MADIARSKGSNGYRAVSTFSGCGGSCLGLEMAGFEILMASEFVEAARDTYRANHPGVFVDDRDIRTVTADDILEQVGLAVGELDLLEGSPPCASFSTAGKRAKGWGEVKKYSETKQQADDLFFEYARLVDGLQPKVFIAENVSGLVKGVAKGYFKMILRELKDCGYRVEAKLLDAKWLGVPQSRQRLIFMGVRNDLGVRPEWPDPLPYWYSIRDACPWITNGGIAKHGFGKLETEVLDGDQPAGTIAVHGFSSQSRHQTLVNPPRQAAIQDWSSDQVVRPITVAGIDGHQSQEHLVNPPDGGGQPGSDWESYLLANGHPAAPPEEFQLVDIRRYAIGREWLRLHQGQISRKYLNLVRTNADKPVNTVTQMAGPGGVAGVTHPSEPRKFTIPELRRLCSFPDDFALTGSFPQRWERLGRAVPPLMMRAVGESVRSVLDKCAD